MGLAASQARFLAITSRKAQCEFESMQIAQQKLSISRELEKATSDYQESLNASRLVLDPDGTGDITFPLNYGIMMNPSDVNDYTPLMLARRDGKIALNGSMAAAAKAAGISDNGSLGGKSRDEAYQAFIEAMVDNGGMSATTAKLLELDSGNTYRYFSRAGIGGNLLDKTQSSEMAIGDLLNFIDQKTNEEPAKMKNADGTLTRDGELYEALNIKLENTKFKEKGDDSFVLNGKNKYDTGEGIKFTLADLLNEDISVSFKESDLEWFKTNAVKMRNITAFSENGYTSLKDILGIDTSEQKSCVTVVMTVLDKIFSGFSKLLDTENSDGAQRAFLYAIQETFNLLTQNTDSCKKNATDITNTTKKYNCWVDVLEGPTYAPSTGNAISLSNLAESFLTFYSQGLDGYGTNCYIRQKSSQSSYITDNQGYYYKIKVGESNLTNEQLWTSEFYSVMFNNIVENGWYENSNIEDNTYLQNAIKNAQLFISSIHTDGYMYQERYLANGFVLEETDDDAIAQAELEFSLIKAKLNSKEEKLDVQMKEIDLEISSLTTEYDTVKSLINKNVEKTFNMFQS